MSQAKQPGEAMRRRADEQETAVPTGQNRRDPVVRPSPAQHVLALQRAVGNRAVAAQLRSTSSRSGVGRTLARAPRWRPVEEIQGEITEATRRKRGAVSAAQDVVEKAGRARPTSHRAGHRQRGPSWSDQLKRALEDVMGDEKVSDELRREAQKALGNLEEVEQDLERLWRERNHPTHPANVPQEYSRHKKPAQTATTKTKAPTTAPAKPAPAPTTAGGGGKVVKEGGEAAAEAVPKLYKRLAEKLGRELVDGLIPDPLDVVEMMYDFAGSYKEAWDRIKRDNVTSGFAVGLAAYLVVPRWEWVKHHALMTASRGVVTQVLGAVGIAENAFNEGLVRGFLYGEKHSPAQADRLRQQAFNALLKAERKAGRYEGDDVWTFGRDDVYTFAGALYPHAVSVLKDADRRKAARVAAEAEKRRKELGLPPPGRAAYKPL